MNQKPHFNRNMYYQEVPNPPRKQQRPKPEFRVAWILVPLCILGMAYILSHIKPVVTWERVMDLLDVKNRERYTMLAQLCLLMILVVASVRILKDKKNHYSNPPPRQPKDHIP